MGADENRLFSPIPDTFNSYLNLITLPRWALYKKFKRVDQIITGFKSHRAYLTLPNNTVYASFQMKYSEDTVMKTSFVKLWY